MKSAAGRWLPTVLWFTCILLLSSIPPSDVPSVEIPHLDKLVHVGIYGILGICLSRTGWSIPRAGLLGAALGVLDEVYQWRFSGRTGDPFDWMADVVGVVLGLCFAGWIRRRWFHEARR